MKKARLDLLEEMPAIEPAQPEIEPIVEEEITEEPVEIKKTFVFNKLLMIGAPVALAVLIISGILIYYLISGKPISQPVHVEKIPVPVEKPVEQPQVPVEVSKPIVVPEITRTIFVKDFMIDLKDNQGKNRVLLCDVAFDIVENAEPEKLESSLDVRNIIYRTTQRRSAVALKSLEERKKLKKELAEQLDRMAGKAIVKNVYFTTYFIM